ncbi:UvrD-helicase domain-containing protein [Desulfatitalea tepidiphila]|uniref:UvrD-helicase domain-containing protein n=1 Tax=Desulfatitalea tepidiphila TaxID=1185843 RepID=UPI0006B51FDF|nr:UvrD-helicase domain-containing protein [Desulfatitalea tepidiphila]
MTFIADFHIHSKYSRATSQQLDLEHLHIAAQIKGIRVIATGDFTHPGWWEEITAKLVPAEEGLFALDPQIAAACDEQVPASCRQPVRFMLVTEISNIYKKGDRTRKNHNLVFMPDLAAAREFNQKLDPIGNIRSDGRPILGLDARNLLEIVLETSDEAYLVPAHIWTPWFSLLGSKSGFDSVQACFEDLSDHLFAVETGLSSDPAMNWRVSGLDRFTLISNSDAHSPGKLGREANLLDVELGFGPIRHALETAAPDQFMGTLEFYPEEGKYHVDGHRKCNFRCQPEQTRTLNGICPVCGKPLVLGVLYRVEQLADRESGLQPPKARPYESLIPLEEILAETFQTSVTTKRVQQACQRLIRRHGSEFDILRNVPIEELSQNGIALFAEAVARMREGRVIFDPGYDGEFGQVRLFEPDERRELCGQTSLFAIADSECRQAKAIKENRPAADCADDEPPPTDGIIRGPTASLAENVLLNSAQQRVVDHPGGALIVAAGPGTGKTRTITCRMAALIRERQVPADAILAVTFTNRAAREMAQRLNAMLGPGSQRPFIATFHSFCRHLLQERDQFAEYGLADDTVRGAILADATTQVKEANPACQVTLARAIDFVVSAKQRLVRPDGDLTPLLPSGSDVDPLRDIYRAYQRLLALQQLLDFEDLILEVVDALETDAAWCRHLQERFTHIFVDEFQDVNHGQYRLIRLLAPPQAHICVIGDPDQAIYGFRGSDVRYFSRFAEDYPGAQRIRLVQNYRSTDAILRAAYQSLKRNGESADGERETTYSLRQGKLTLTILESASARAEAVAIGRCIEQMVGGTGFHAIDFGKVQDKKEDRSFSDFAVLFRTNDQGRLIDEVLRKAGIPCQFVSKEVLTQQRGMVKIMALLRVISSRGSYADLCQLNDIVTPGVGQDTLNVFKTWAYALGLPLERALNSAIRLPIQGLSTARQQRLVDLIRRVQSLRNEGSNLSVAEMIERILARTMLAHQIDPRERQDLLSLAAHYDGDLQAFLDGQVMRSDTDLYRPEAERVALMTMHAAKGLEFAVVFIAGCEEGLVPYIPPGQAACDVEEERRLLFVAMTRAKERLYLSWARKRTLYGKTEARRPTSFWEPIDPKLLERLSQPVKKASPQQLSLF